MSVSQEDFLKTMYHISFDENGEASSSELARRLSISNAAITDMARKLSSQGDIIYKKYKALKLTEKGKQRAVELIRKHRLWETFLHRVLGFSSGDVHREAELLEHSTSNKLLDKIDEYLGHPEFDPHGDPIPGKSGKIPKQTGIFRLNNCAPGIYKIVRLQHRVPEVSSFLTEYGFELGKSIELINKMTASSSLTIKINELQLVINDTLASNIHVKINSHGI